MLSNLKHSFKPFNARSLCALPVSSVTPPNMEATPRTSAESDDTYTDQLATEKPGTGGQHEVTASKTFVFQGENGYKRYIRANPP